MHYFTFLTHALKKIKFKENYIYIYIYVSHQYIFFISCWFLSLASDAVILEDYKNTNVNSCIIYEMCIKEKCNSLINKYLSSFGTESRALFFFVIMTFFKTLKLKSCNGVIIIVSIRDTIAALCNEPVENPGLGFNSI